MSDDVPVTTLSAFDGRHVIASKALGLAERDIVLKAEKIQSNASPFLQKITCRKTKLYRSKNIHGEAYLSHFAEIFANARSQTMFHRDVAFLNTIFTASMVSLGRKKTVGLTVAMCELVVKDVFYTLLRQNAQRLTGRGLAEFFQ